MPINDIRASQFISYSDGLTPAPTPTTRQGTIADEADIEDGGVWVTISSKDGGGRVFVAIHVNRAYGVGTQLTVNGDRGYF